MKKQKEVSFEIPVTIEGVTEKYKFRVPPEYKNWDFAEVDIANILIHNQTNKLFNDNRKKSNFSPQIFSLSTSKEIAIIAYLFNKVNRLKALLSNIDRLAKDKGE
jgi:hypothetical protein